MASCKEAAINTDPAKTACGNRVNEAHVYLEFKTSDRASLQVGARYSRSPSGNLTRFDESAMRVVCGVEHAKRTARQEIRIIETILTGRSEVEGIVRNLMMPN